MKILVADQGINGFYYFPQMRKTCCAVHKVEPLNRALKGATAWVTGLRRDRSKARKNLDFIILDKERALLKINPLYDLIHDEIITLTEHMASLSIYCHAAGFLSVGCAPHALSGLVKMNVQAGGGR